MFIRNPCIHCELNEKITPGSNNNVTSGGAKIHYFGNKNDKKIKGERPQDKVMSQVQKLLREKRSRREVKREYIILENNNDNKGQENKGRRQHDVPRPVIVMRIKIKINIEWQGCLIF